MELSEVMRTTPATRDFLPDDLPDDVLYEILDQARFAPNGGNRQAWHVIVVRDQATKDRIGELYLEGGREYAAHHRAGVIPFQASRAGNESEPAVDLAAARTDTTLATPGFDHVATAPVHLVVCIDLERVSCVDTGLGRLPLTTAASVYPFCHNILLAARDRGYGGTITSLLSRSEPQVRALLGIPDNYVLASLLPLGRPVKVLTRLRREPVEAFTTRERFDGAPFTR
jgi:nitroreductase